MKIGALALVAVLAVTGCGAVTGCSSFSSSLNHIVDPTPSASPTKSCYLQLRKWNRNLKPLDRKFRAMSRRVRVEAEAGNLPQYLRSLRTFGRALDRLPHIPYCADPHGFLARIIGKINAAADNARSASREGLHAALAPLRQVAPLFKKLLRELDRRVHKLTHTPGTILTAVTRQQG
jgi:hypothetical protein